MPDPALCHPVEEAARFFAYGTYLRSHPGEETSAAAFAERNWRQFVDTALDFLALQAALTEAEAAAPNN